MKKFAFLTSVLALTACGGGHHGGVAPQDVFTAEQRAAMESNKNVTGMNSFIVVGGTNPTANQNARPGSEGIQMEDGGVRYDLSNVKLHTTTFTEDFVSPDSGADINFETDENGKIVKISATGPRQFPDGIVATRVSDDSDVFVGNLTFAGEREVHDENGNPVLDEDGHVVYEPEVLHFENFKMGYNSFGKDLGLQYSDFGSLGLAQADEELTEDGEFFAGGYDVKKIDPQNIATKPEFTGVAKGTVSVGYEDDSPSIALRDNNAKLVFNNGVSTLNASFDNWYDVSAKMDENGKLSGIAFNNGNKETFTNGYAFNGENAAGHHDAVPTQYRPGSGPNTIMSGFVEYYGDNNNPAEAVGVLKYAESEGGHNEDGDTMLLFDMGFGVKRD